MAKRELGPATLAMVQAVDEAVSGAMLVGCSGGPDSLALALASAVVARSRGLAHRVVVIDHGLQPGSREQADAVVALLTGRGIPAVAMSVVVANAGEGIEAAARRARYEALTAAASGDEVILLGHTLDDQAETVLLGLARGSGTRSLAGMPAGRGRFVRPLLGLRAGTTREACREAGVAWWDDPHNASTRFTRVRVRTRVMPRLEAELGPGVAEALARTARLARADADLLDGLAARERAAHPGDELDAAWLAALPEALRHRVLRDWLRERGAGDLSATHIWSVAALVTDWHGQGEVDVPGVRVRRRHGSLRCSVRDAGGGHSAAPNR